MEIRAKDIVSASDGDVSFQTAGKWLKSGAPSVAVKYALKYFGLVVGSAEISSEPGPSPPESAVPLRATVPGRVGSEQPAEYRPARSGLNTMDAPMTKRFKGDFKGYGEVWVLYAKEYKYILPLAWIDCKLLTDEGVFSFSDFVEAK